MIVWVKLYSIISYPQLIQKTLEFYKLFVSFSIFHFLETFFWTWKSGKHKYDMIYYIENGWIYLIQRFILTYNCVYCLFVYSRHHKIENRTTVWYLYQHKSYVFIISIYEIKLDIKKHSLVATTEQWKLRRHFRSSENSSNKFNLIGLFVNRFNKSINGLCEKQSWHDEHCKINSQNSLYKVKSVQIEVLELSNVSYTLYATS